MIICMHNQLYRDTYYYIFNKAMEKSLLSKNQFKLHYILNKSKLLLSH